MSATLKYNLLSLLSLFYQNLLRISGVKLWLHSQWGAVYDCKAVMS